MSIINLATLKFGSGGGMGVQRFDLVSQSDSTGAQQVRVLAPPRWTMRLVQTPTVSPIEAGKWASLVVKLRGRNNVLAAWDIGRAAPLGTMRGTITLAASVAVGATTASFSAGAGQAGTTILEGDWFTIGSGLGTSRLVMATADSTSNGSGVNSVTFEPPLSIAFSSGTAVNWDKALCYYRQRSSQTTWTHDDSGKSVTGFSLDLMETWS